MNNESILFKFPIGEILERFKPLISSVVAEEIAKLNLIAITDSDDWLTIKEVCKLLGLSKPSIARYTQIGILKGYRIGRNVRYRRKEVIAGMQQMKQANTIVR